MLENKKVESLKTFYSKAKKHTSQFLPALNSIRKSQYVRRQLTWAILSLKSTVIFPKRLRKNQQRVRNLETFMTSTSFLKCKNMPKDTHAQIWKRTNRYAGSLFLSQQQNIFHSLTPSKYLWAEMLQKLPKIINYIGFKTKIMIRLLTSVSVKWSIFMIKATFI